MPEYARAERRGKLAITAGAEGPGTACLLSQIHALSPVPEDKDADWEQRLTDADALAKALELELKFKRASWEKARAKANMWRLLSILFVLLVLLAALFAFFFLLPQIRSRGAERANPRVPSLG